MEKKKKCMNELCGTMSSDEWKIGWNLRSGQFATLCRKCGYAFEQRVFCEEFHSGESGWRNCGTCSKQLHCGCIASLSMVEVLDGGGVKCVGCARNSDPNSIYTVSENNVGIDSHKGNNGSNQLSMPNILNSNASLGLLKQEGLIFPTAEIGAMTPPPLLSIDNAVKCGAWRTEPTWASTLAQTSMGSFLKDRLDGSSNTMHIMDNYESVAHPNLNISLGVSSGNLQFSSSTIDEREKRKISNAFNQGLVSPCLVPSPPKLPFSPASDSNMSMMPQFRLARPPAEGRGRHQLLPRYWPRITDQELQQISGDSNCTIIPLFEKVLSASDAGRIGRLVLPKACAEAYFPPISQPEGLPIKILDVKGKEWVFQFRFWPNNNSRMYVLEGVTPCIQSMQLQAGDTVTFSRRDPEGKLVMGFRKASNSSMQPMKGSTDTHMNALSRQMDSAGGSGNLLNSERCGEPTEEGLLSSSTTMTDRKKGRNIGGKSKRLLMDSQEVQALRLTWEEVQGLLRPPQNIKPSVVVVEDFEFEEYEEPPVFGKSSVFASRSPGVIEQWTQCDSCSKWRRLPADFLLPPKWTCMENIWDQTRCFCSAPDELTPRDLEILFNLSKDSSKKRMTMANKAIQEQESSGLGGLAIEEGLGDDPNEPGTSAVATTTKHPRHRPGCSCIVCIQPPSGKGKHKSTCTCTVCMTVKRRFKTLMMRKKKRQSDQEAEMVLKTRQMQNFNKEDDKDEGQNISTELADCGASLDLNFHPEREEDLKTTDNEMGSPNLLELTSVPIESPLKQSPEEEASPGANPGQDSGETEGQQVTEHPHSQVLPEQVNANEESCEPENETTKNSGSQMK